MTVAQWVDRNRHPEQCPGLSDPSSCIKEEGWKIPASGLQSKALLQCSPRQPAARRIQLCVCADIWWWTGDIAAADCVTVKGRVQLNLLTKDIKASKLQITKEGVIIITPLFVSCLPFSVILLSCLFFCLHPLPCSPTLISALLDPSIHLCFPSQIEIHAIFIRLTVRKVAVRGMRSLQALY